MNNFETLIAKLWNNRVSRQLDRCTQDGLKIGAAVTDGHLSQNFITIPQNRRTHHIAILGKTGTGKSSLLRFLAEQDIRNDNGLIGFDLHGDTTPYVLRLIAAEERRRARDLSDRVIVIEPADSEYSIGLNVLASGSGRHSFVQIAEFAEILKQRWHLQAFGARTEELLRNALHTLADNRLTLLELSPLLSNRAFRASCLPRITNPEVRGYFENRYDRATEAMQAVIADAILNKVSAFTADPHFRHIVGQRESSFSLVQAIDEGYWILLNLDKARLGDHSATLGSLFLAQVKNALFARRRREVFTLYCDEIQNLVAYDTGLDTLLSEARKFGIAVCSANQYLDQYPPPMRSAILAVGTHILFQLSSGDASKMAAALDGGKPLEELLKNLSQRHMVIKSGHYRWQQSVVPLLKSPDGDYLDLYRRSRARWARSRMNVEQEIAQRHAQANRSSNEVLHDWE
jgi:hypothetical protein